MPDVFYLREGMNPLKWLAYLLYPGPGTGIDEVLGRWAAALLTVAIFSFLFSDNPFFKLAEHVFIGVGTGYQIARYFNDSIYDKAYKPLFDPPAGTAPDWWVIIPAILGALTLLKLIPSLSFWSRWPIAFVAGVTMGLAIITNLQSNVVTQVEATIKPFRFIDEASRIHHWQLKTPEDVRELEAKKKAWALSHGALKPEDEKKLDDELEAEIVKRQLVLLEAAGKLEKSGWADREKDLKLLAMMVKPAFKNQEEIPPEPLLDIIVPMRAVVRDEMEKDAKQVLAMAPEGSTGAGGPPDPNLKRARDSLMDKYKFWPPTDATELKLPIEKQIMLSSYVDRVAAARGVVPLKSDLKFTQWIRILNAFLIALGVLSGLVYFFFSKEHTGLVFGGLARIGVWFLMIAFGGSFGFTVMGRISLLIGRIQFLLGDWLHLSRDFSGIVPGF